MAVSEQFAREIASVLSRSGLSQREAAKRTRVSPGRVSNMCLGHVPRLGTLLQFSGRLGVDPTPLIAAADYPHLNDDSLPTDSTTAARKDRHRGMKEERAGDDPIPPPCRAMTDFCLRVRGDSMWPHLQHGDVVGVKAQDHAEIGQVVVARQGELLTIKRLNYRQGRWALEPCNPLYPPIPVMLDDPNFAVVGVIVWHTHDWLTDRDQAKSR